MNRRLFIAFLMLFAMGAKAQQKVIHLYDGPAPGTENWNYNEKEYTNSVLHSTLAYNISQPTLTVYPADPAIATGTGVIVCPGGGFYILSMTSEGTDVAHWLNQKGITVFILKYRVGQSVTDDPGKELGENMRKSDFADKIKPIIPFSIADGHAAVKYVRAHAAEYGISPSRIGIIGFSAGGTVAASSAFNYNADDRPDFVAPIYAYMPPALQGSLVANEPPMFLAAATDDQLGLAAHSIDLYSKWLVSKHITEIHIYAKGGHGFGMRKQDIPADNWIDRFGDWLGQQGFLKPIDPKVVAHLDQMEKNNKYAGYLLRKDWPNLKRYESQNAQVAPPLKGEKRVVFMGNSITDGWKYVDSSFFYGRPYYDRGISGQTTGQMLLRFREDVINLKPAIVVILAGINDIAENNGPSKLEDVFGNIVSMAELARASHIKVVLSSVMPAFSFPWRPTIDPKPGVTALNAMIKDYCDKNDIVYLDYFTAMADERRGLPKSLSGDGVHPTLAGYKVMEPLAEKAIDEAMKRKK
ncbi:MAG TPA: G-D-S-L family lipolytic protein [Mucilaginibacter sp.]|jgi:acetyl esterase/lipase/lysophospholipase L1-like esterase|nr:G-D-S-L family lipolytic protein [Mucilaginibacter sp.]